MKDTNHIKQFGIFVFIFAIFCVLLAENSFVYADDEMTEEEKKELEEKEEEYEEKVEKEEEKKASLQGNLNVVTQSLGKTKRTINEVMEDIEKKENDIERHDAQIKALNNEMQLYRSSLADTLRRAYFASNSQSLIHVIENSGSDRFLKKTDSLDDMRQKIIDVVNKVENAKKIQQQKKDELGELKKEKEKLLSEHKEAESALLAQSTNVKTEIIRVDASISELNAKISAVENKLSSLLGESFDTDDIVQAAKFASKKTGVRKDFILGMLVVETNLGRFTGGCTYKESKMSDYRADIFKDICKDLDYNYKKQKVSCSPENYKGTGGAMGVAQFMSDTWKGYESKIASATGHNPPDPWSLTDGVMAMALKLANDGATKKSGEWKAASRYLGTCSTASTKFYCEDVLWWADNYEKKL